MPDIDTVRTWQGRTLVDRDGSRIGTIDAIYLDDQTGQPEWALVNTGVFGTKSSFVPLAQATQTDNDVRVPYDKQLVKDARRAAAVAPLRPGLRPHHQAARDRPRRSGARHLGAEH
jgi:hypothetical protein